MISLEGDVRDYSNLKKIITKYEPEIIIHMAAQSLVSESYEDPIETYSTNVMGTANLLDIIKNNHKTRVVINVTSDKCYENNELGRSFKENDSMGGFDPYSSSKGCSELLTSSYRNSFFHPSTYKKHQTAIASVRAGNVIGGGDWSNKRLIPDIVRGILEKNTIIIRNPNAIRPWQHVLEPLNGYLMLIEKLWEDGPNYMEGWNFGPDEVDIKPVNWMVDKFTKLWNSDIKWKTVDGDFYESDILRLDCSKAKKKLGWKPKTNSDLGLKWTVDWYKKYSKDMDMRTVTENQIENFLSL